MADRKLKKCKYKNNKNKCCLNATFNGKWIDCYLEKQGCWYYNEKLYEGKH